jgi:antitoxin ParD1/3/4
LPKNTSVVLGKEHAAFIAKQVRKGRFGSASEAVRAGLRLLEEQELKLERLRAALTEGEAEDDPFAVFTEWSGEADDKAYGKL